MTGEKVNPIPNILTLIRLIAGLAMFVMLDGAAGGIPFLSPSLNSEMQFVLLRWSVYAFVIASLTDLFDGMLARQLHAESRWGAILDPIADKILVCGTILGLFTLNTADPVFALPSAIILFREFAVSALRESVAGRGVQVPVSLLGKIKTTVQLFALGSLLLYQSWTAFGFEPGLANAVSLLAFILMWGAALISIWTGAAYFIAARKDI